MLRGNIPDTTALLTPTLPSFDLDYDDDDESTDEDVATASNPSHSRRHVNRPVTLTLDDDPPLQVRPARSSTIDSGTRPHMSSLLLPHHLRGGDDKEHNRMIRMLYSRSIVGQVHVDAHSRRLHDLVQSMTCFQTKKDRVFEHFVVTGLLTSSSSGLERATAADGNDDSSCGYKPKVLFQYPPPSIHPINEQAVSGFCFPVGVPAFTCSGKDAVAIQGHLVSQWTLDGPSTLRQLLDPHNAQCYTFRLTGSKGEALYGFCAAILMDAAEPPILIDQSNGTAHVATQEQRVDAPLTRPVHPSTPPASPTKKKPIPTSLSATTFHSLAGILASPVTAKSDDDRGTTLITPRCYCITSKYPLYKLHFQILRLVIEADLKSRQAARTSPAYHRAQDIEVVLTQRVLGLTLRERDESVHHPSRGIKPRDAALLNAIATKQKTSGVVAIAETRDGARTPPKTPPSPPTTAQSPPRRRLVRSHSWTANFTRPKQKQPLGTPSGCRPTTSIVVHACSAAASAAGIEPDDIVRAVNGFPLDHMTFVDVVHLLESSKRPLKLGLRRRLPATKPPSAPPTSPGAKDSSSSSSAVLDLLRRFRGMQVGSPGAWSSIHLPLTEFKYRFPVDQAATDNWTVAVLLRLVGAPTVVKLVSCLLLEKQVAIVSDSTAKLSVVSTALLVLLRPFQWQSTFIPILPANLLEFLHSPVPYLVGVHSVVVTMEDWPDVCFVHVDADSMQCPYSSLLLSFPRANDLTKLLHDASAALRAMSSRPGQPWHDLTGGWMRLSCEYKLILVDM
ncbi:hypothetical protein, variant 1 [Aphanomyces astaci]|uniref:UDENN domain-containing protein n=1 Tax=Aphanomyces astaci TaxID=112090 RepID=W4GP66_APHAT|nr:hypothetical protein, variant 1 [Aphanomyces astaci]ETV80663.1 hypothetical protein, variant 1 [Aphanomyces astaci]|eukprot:XP_009829614.1 hypothetical protein, variant 1 [Aphanomyces astaci]